MRNLLLIVLLGLFISLLGACAKKEEAQESAVVRPSEEAGEIGRASCRERV